MQQPKQHKHQRQKTPKRQKRPKTQKKIGKGQKRKKESWIICLGSRGSITSEGWGTIQPRESAPPSNVYKRGGGAGWVPQTPSEPPSLL